MLPVSNYSWRRPDWTSSGPQKVTITIEPGGAVAPVDPDGDINLYTQASHIFGQLAENNVFTGNVNTFQEVHVRRLHVLSGPEVRRRPLPSAPLHPIDMQAKRRCHQPPGRRASSIAAHCPRGGGNATRATPRSVSLRPRRTGSPHAKARGTMVEANPLLASW